MLLTMDEVQQKVDGTSCITAEEESLDLMINF
jgi:hypothetical protein